MRDKKMESKGNPLLADLRLFALRVIFSSEEIM
jgi:hypothetical protein